MTTNTDRAALEADFRHFMSGKCSCPTCVNTATPRKDFGAPMDEATRQAMLEGCPSWMPGEPKRVTL